MKGLISKINSWVAPKLAEALSTHLTIVKSVLDKLDQVAASCRDTFVAKVVASYITTRDTIRVQFEQQIMDEIAHLEGTSQHLERLTASLEGQEVKYEVVVKFIHLSEESIRRLEESLT